MRARLLSSEGSFDESQWDVGAHPPPLGSVDLTDRHGAPFRLSADGLVERRSTAARLLGHTGGGGDYLPQGAPQGVPPGAPLSSGLRALVRGAANGLASPREPLLPTGSTQSRKKDW